MGSSVWIIVIVSVIVPLVIAGVVLKSSGVVGSGRKKVLANGIAGQALIMGSSPTGTVINEINYVVKFQLRVEIPGRQPYDVEAKDTIPITSMGAITPGTTVAVKVDPTDQSKVAIDWSQGVQIGGAGMASGGAGPANFSAGELATALHDPNNLSHVQSASAADLLRTGQRATGYLKSFADSGQTPRSAGRQLPPEQMDDPLFVLTLDVTFGPGMPPIEAVVLHRVPRAIAPMLRIGMQLNCAVDPANPTRRVAVDWSTLPTAGSTPGAAAATS
jgi:hypothetical protein